MRNMEFWNASEQGKKAWNQVFASICLQIIAICDDDQFDVNNIYISRFHVLLKGNAYLWWIDQSNLIIPECADYQVVYHPPTVTRRLPFKYFPATGNQRTWVLSILIWRIFGFGASPFVLESECTEDEFKQKLVDGLQLKLYDQNLFDIDLPQEIFYLLSSCWNQDPSMRPSLDRMRRILDDVCWPGKKMCRDAVIVWLGSWRNLPPAYRVTSDSAWIIARTIWGTRCDFAWIPKE